MGLGRARTIGAKALLIHPSYQGVCWRHDTEDSCVRHKGYQLTRWADDWVVTCRTRAEAQSALAQATKILGKLGVERAREDWITIAVPQIVSEETFALAQEHL
jgi:hypothetical protein